MRKHFGTFEKWAPGFVNVRIIDGFQETRTISLLNFIPQGLRFTPAETGTGEQMEAFSGSSHSPRGSSLLDKSFN